jgi:serine/threonine protein kinase
MPLYQSNDIILNGKYKIEKQLGAGAFGEVLLAKHLELNHQRAIKVVSKEMPGLGSSLYDEAFNRFRQEAQIGAKLQSPHLIQVFDFEVAEERLHLVMEYAPKGSLEDKLKTTKKAQEFLSEEVTLKIAREIALGLNDLHHQQIIHRDLKPSNILFTQQGVAKLADLGLAQVPGGTSMRSRMGSLAEMSPHPGTPDYMSPEQQESFSALQPPSDIYALGLVLFEMLTGKNPYYLRPGTQLTDLRPELEQEVSDLVGCMLNKNPQERFWDGEELLRQIEKLNNDKNIENLKQQKREDHRELPSKQINVFEKGPGGTGIPKELENSGALFEGKKKNEFSPPINEEPNAKIMEKLSIRNDPQKNQVASEDRNSNIDRDKNPGIKGLQDKLIDDTKKEFWKFVLYWTLAGIFSLTGTVGVVLIPNLIFIKSYLDQKGVIDHILLLVFYLVFYSAPQWFVLRNYLDKAYGWMKWSLIGALPNLLILIILTPTIYDYTDWRMLTIASGYIIISLFQYTFLKRHLYFSGLWIFVSPLLLLFITFFLGVYYQFINVLSWEKIIYGLLYGVSTGVLLAFLMKYTARKKRAHFSMVE